MFTDEESNGPISFDPRCWVHGNIINISKHDILIFSKISSCGGVRGMESGPTPRCGHKKSNGPTTINPRCFGLDDIDISILIFWNVSSCDAVKFKQWISQ